MARANSALLSSLSPAVPMRLVVSTQLMLQNEAGAFSDMQPSQIPGTKPAMTPRDFFRQHAHSGAGAA